MALLDKWSNIPLGFGGASISGEGAGYGFGDITENDAIDLLKQAKDSGITIFDTAPIYGFGLSEKRIGMAFKNERESVHIISKSGVTWHPNMRVDMTNDPKVTAKMLEQSLRDLNTEYIDLYMIHWPDKNVDIRRPLEVLAKAKHEGKIKHIGLCNTTKEDLILASEIDRVEAVQSQLNVFERDAVSDLFEYLTEQNIDFMSWGTLDKGIITGRVNEKRKFDRSDCRSWAPWWKAMDKKPRYDKMNLILPLLEQQGHSGLEFALWHNLQFEQVKLLLCGARNKTQLEGLIKAIQNKPNQELLEKCIEIAYEN